MAGYSYALTYDECGKKSVLFGGFAPGQKFDDTWAWEHLGSEGPTARDSPAIAYNSRQKKILLFGGHLYDNSFTDDTWEWNGRAWCQIDAAGPCARNHSSMVYDHARKRAILFGGRSRIDGELVQLGDTWEWDGAEWRQVSDSGPGPRAPPGMVYDRANDNVILHGGWYNDTPYLGDSWRWDGSTWVELDVASPPARARTFMAFLEGQGTAMLFGGASASGALQDTWEWDGERWRQIS